MTEARERKRAETVTRTEVVLPGMTNNHNTMFGGFVLQMMDMTCAIAAARFCSQPVVTISSERVDFKVPIRAGYTVELTARVVYTGTTSMAVKVQVYSQPFTGGNRRLCTEGFFNFVALDRTGRSTAVVPELIVETDEERRDWDTAEHLRKSRI